MKITPAHDHNDYEVGKRHDLPFITIIDDSGCMTKSCGKFSVSREMTVLKINCRAGSINVWCRFSKKYVSPLSALGHWMNVHSRTSLDSCVNEFPEMAICTISLKRRNSH